MSILTHGLSARPNESGTSSHDHTHRHDCPPRLPLVAIAVAASGILATAHGQPTTDYVPMDPIPRVVDLPPDPCDNPTTRMWGADDTLGNLNYLTPERVQERLRAIRLGRIYHLAHDIEPGQMGFLAFFDYEMRLGPWPGRGNTHTIFNEEEAVGGRGYNQAHDGVRISSLGTQLDGFNHSTQGGITYNCFDTRDPAYHLLAEGDPGELPKGSPGPDYKFRGYSRGSIEKIGTIVARAVLIDVGQLLREREIAAGRDAEQFPPADYEFSPEELEQALVRQGMTLDDIDPGDAILVRTGWGARYWTSNPADPRHEIAKYFNGDQEELRPNGPGLNLRAVQWTINRRPVLVGADNTSVESSLLAPLSAQKIGHISWLSSGIYMIEDLDLEEIAADCEAERSTGVAAAEQPDARNDDGNCYAFTLMVQTLPFKGFTASAVAPIAIR